MPLSVDRVLRKAKQLASRGETTLAAQEYERVLAKFPKNRQAIEGLEALRRAATNLPQEQRDGLIALHSQGRLQQAIVAGEALAKQFPEDPFIPDLLGVANFGLRRFEQAVAQFTRALQLGPGSAELHNSLGNALNVLGRTEQAAASYKKALQLRPDYAEAHRNLSVIKTYQAGDPQIRQMLGFLEGRGTSHKDRMLLNFALGKAFDDTGDYDNAFSYIASGNRLRRKDVRYDLAAVKASLANTKFAFSESVPALDEVAELTSGENVRPIFVLGMPRSGTSLVEQILATHPEVFGAGELGLLGESVNSMPWTSPQITSDRLQAIRDIYLSGLRKIGAPERVITDKMPFNFFWLGFVALALPEAKIIHVTRDARAICWSNFENGFSGEGTEFAYDLADVAHYYVMYADLMTFWHERFPGRIYDLSYEALTENQESETRKLLQFVGLDWDARCMEFHQTQRAVRTASATQVRQQMYRGSSDKWRRYEKHLGRMLRILSRISA